VPIGLFLTSETTGQVSYQLPHYPSKPAHILISISPERRRTTKKEATTHCVSGGRGFTGLGSSTFPLRNLHSKPVRSRAALERHNINRGRERRRRTTPVVGSALSFRAQAVGSVCARWVCRQAPTSQWKRDPLTLAAGEKAEAEAEAEADVLEHITCCFPVVTRFTCRVE
jgi:hypothetical protein